MPSRADCTITRPPDIPDGVSDAGWSARMAEFTGTWSAHLAACPQHCRCVAVSEYCMALATGEDGLCDGCREAWDPERPRAEVERRMLCGLLGHAGPYWPGIEDVSR